MSASPERSRAPLVLKSGRELPSDRALVMGVLNVTPDSFSDGGRWAIEETAVARALEMIAEGADIIDIGGESSRPGASPVEANEEQHRVLPVIRALRHRSSVPISIDTYRAGTAEAAIDAGADIVNDISALRADKAMASVVQKSQVSVVLMHMQGTPKDMQANPHYRDCVREIGEFFDERLSFCDQIGISRMRVILDPGIGFGKRLQDNLDLLRELRQFLRFGLPLLVGASRKSFIAAATGSDRAPECRLGGSIAAALIAVQHGADIVRVHDVEQTVEALALMKALQ